MKSLTLVLPIPQTRTINPSCRKIRHPCPPAIGDTVPPPHSSFSALLRLLAFLLKARSRAVVTVLRFVLYCSHVLRRFCKMPTSNAAVLKFAKAIPEAFAPSKGSTKAAGYDLKSARDYVVPARGKEIVDTGIKVQLPEGCYGRIAPRSGLAAKNCIDVGGELGENGAVRFE